MKDIMRNGRESFGFYQRFCFIGWLDSVSYSVCILFCLWFSLLVLSVFGFVCLIVKLSYWLVEQNPRLTFLGLGIEMELKGFWLCFWWSLDCDQTCYIWMCFLLLFIGVSFFWIGGCLSYLISTCNCVWISLSNLI